MALTYKDVFELNNYEFMKWLKESFPVEVPRRIETIEEMEKASQVMLKLSAQYEYIGEMLSYAKIYCRELRRMKDKEDADTILAYEEMADKRDIIETKMKSIHQAYLGISRAVTIKIENNAELRMTGTRSVRVA